MFSQQTFSDQFGFGGLCTSTGMSVLHVGITCQGASSKFSVHLEITINARESACQVLGSLTVCHIHSMFYDLHNSQIHTVCRFAIVQLVHSRYVVYSNSQ